MRALRPIALFAAVLSTAILAACDDGPTGNEAQPNRALYAAALTLDGRVGAFVVDGADALDVGAILEVRFENDRSIVGRLFAPAGVLGESAVDLEFVGSWSASDGDARIDPTAQTFLEELAFSIEPGRLTAEGSVDGRAFLVTLQSVARSDPTLVDTGVEVLEVLAVSSTGDGEVAWGEMVVESEANETIALALQACPVFLRARPENEDEVVWDQAIHQGCDGLRRLLILDPGESVTLRTPSQTPQDVLRDELPSGFYDFSVVLPLDGEEIEVEIDARTFISGDD